MLFPRVATERAVSAMRPGFMRMPSPSLQGSHAVAGDTIRPSFRSARGTVVHAENGDFLGGFKRRRAAKLKAERYAAECMSLHKKYATIAALEPILAGIVVKDADALHRLGECFDRGKLGIELDRTQAFRWFSEAAALDHAQSLLRVGDYHRYGLGNAEVDLQRAFGCYERAANLGDVAAMKALGAMYLAGFGERAPDICSAKTFLSIAAEQGDLESAVSMAYIYQAGHDGIAADDAKALRILKPFVAKGGDEAIYHYARTLYNCRTETADNQRLARSYLEQLADRRHSSAMSALGMLHWLGRGGLSPNRKRAYEYLSASALLGNADALGNLRQLALRS